MAEDAVQAASIRLTGELAGTAREILAGNQVPAEPA